MPAHPLVAQEGAPAPHLAEMKKLDVLVGNWKGEGWAFTRSGRTEFISTERVERQLDGLLLVIEGLHHQKLEGGKEGRVVHNAYAVVSYDPPGMGYLFDAYQLNGQHINAKAKLAGPGTFEWGFTSPQGTIRYTIKFDDNRWNEVGEVSQDGTTWRKIFEMNLHRVK
jgi:hypothetical protein